MKKCIPLCFSQGGMFFSFFLRSVAFSPHQSASQPASPQGEAFGIPYQQIIIPS
jgi:hypothetical protein